VTQAQAREEICRVGKSLFDRGYVHATAGNISWRLDDGSVLITPTDACLGFLDPARLALVDVQGAHVSGDRPSKTVILHSRIVQAATKYDAGTRCVLHTHSTHCVALSLASQDEELLPPVTPYFVMKVGHVPHLAYHRPGAPEAADAVARLIEPGAAMAVLEELEETARLACLARTPLQSLEPCAIEELRASFGARW
jgi:ribulose-5-phosphate 4-epimerase/fuculose-1-phosphate aldolase